MNDERAAELIAQIKRAFPPVSKPADVDLVEHPAGCVECAWVENHLRSVPGPLLPREALRGLHSDMSCLTPAGWRWALPSFLRHCLTGPHDDDLETEYMIYFLGGVDASQPDAREQLALFDQSQIDCVLRVLEWCSATPQWSEYCAVEIERAIAFMTCLHNERQC